MVRDGIEARAEHVTGDDAARLFQYLRTNGIAGQTDHLARAATGGHHSTKSLLAALAEAEERHGATGVRDLLRGFDVAGIRRLGTLLADQDESRAAMTIFSALARAVGPQALLKEGRFILAELSIEAGRTDDLPGLYDTLHIGRDDVAQRWLFTANAHNPFRDSRANVGPPEAWCEAVSEMFAIDGLESIHIASGNEAPFDRIACGAARSVAKGPLVTVVIPTYAPGPRIATAVESLLAQSHQSLQILIVDDGSPRHAAEELDQWTRRDARIDVIHLPKNGGPYLARNTAVAHYARGEYISIHDDDDWSHPRKIEAQVAQLESAQQDAANMVNGVRASDELVFGRVNGNPVWTQQALSSLMVRRTVFDQIGYWDLVNRAADAEFNDRVRSWTGQRIPIVGRVPLMFYRVRWGSLSDGEFRRGYMDPRRRWYFQAYRAWHDECRALRRNPYIPADNRGARSFVAPVDFLRPRGLSAGQPVKSDVVVVSDFRRKGAAADLLCDEIEGGLAAGLRVALLQCDSPDVDMEARIEPRLLRAAAHERAQVISLKDSLTCSAAVVCDPSILPFLPDLSANIRTNRVIVTWTLFGERRTAGFRRRAPTTIFGVIPSDADAIPRLSSLVKSADG